jgi:hypothetical protein
MFPKEKSHQEGTKSAGGVFQRVARLLTKPYTFISNPTNTKKKKKKKRGQRLTC